MEQKKINFRTRNQLLELRKLDLQSSGDFADFFDSVEDIFAERNAAALEAVDLTGLELVDVSVSVLLLSWSPDSVVAADWLCSGSG